MKKGVALSKETMGWINSLQIGARGRNWAKCSTGHLEELIESGQAFFFQWRGMDYFIERGGDGFLIQDPQIEKPDAPYTDYPGHEAAKTPEELMALPFLDGKTIFERFDELRFFD